MELSDLVNNYQMRTLINDYKNGKFGEVNSLSGGIKKPKSEIKIFDNNIQIDSNISKNDNYLMIEFNVNQDSLKKVLSYENLENSYLGQDIILVIDRSGSMIAKVGLQDKNGKELETGLSIQQIVNHSAKTIVQTLIKIHVLVF